MLFQAVHTFITMLLKVHGIIVKGRTIQFVMLNRLCFTCPHKTPLFVPYMYQPTTRVPNSFTIATICARRLITQ